MDPSDGKLSHDDPNSEVGDLDCDDDTKIQIFNHKCYQVPDDEKDLHVIEKNDICTAFFFLDLGSYYLPQFNSCPFKTQTKNESLFQEAPSTTTSPVVVTNDVHDDDNDDDTAASDVDDKTKESGANSILLFNSIALVTFVLHLV